ncbi:hypothetical protein F2Q69_00025460 [Brassica cretica]|uniref:Uncharacterized protein n=1 Tax=Brassica cretica TaxID=69181 RepID=A0A8S9QAE9_BRACR|nr:hypothetical protein F2Q69_00025460 [Brassica cretica]
MAWAIKNTNCSDGVVCEPAYSDGGLLHRLCVRGKRKVSARGCEARGGTVLESNKASQHQLKSNKAFTL